MVNLISKAEALIHEKFSGEGTGHDAHHIFRVRDVALHLAKAEKADLFIVELGALLHDIADHKFHNGDLEAGPKFAREWLHEQGAEEDLIQRIEMIIREVSYKGAGVDTTPGTLEAKVVQDADRLDAIGAIGIARAFAYGGSKRRPLYDPEVAPELHTSFEGYFKGGTHTVNHFYEKLLLLKDRMNTPTGKRLAEERHRFMEDFLARFFEEWKGAK